MQVPGQICGWEFIWVARTLRRATAHVQGLQHLSQAPGAWQPGVSQEGEPRFPHPAFQRHWYMSLGLCPVIS